MSGSVQAVIRRMNLRSTVTNLIKQLKNKNQKVDTLKRIMKKIKDEKEILEVEIEKLKVKNEKFENNNYILTQQLAILTNRTRILKRQSRGA